MIEKMKGNLTNKKWNQNPPRTTLEVKEEVIGRRRKQGRPKTTKEKQGNQKVSWL